jgi:hypothetical protein
MFCEKPIDFSKKYIQGELVVCFKMKTYETLVEVEKRFTEQELLTIHSKRCMDYKCKITNCNEFKKKHIFKTLTKKYDNLPLPL